MNRRAGSSRRPHKVTAKPTKQSRRERQKVGPLAELVIQSKTRDRYKESLFVHHLAETFQFPDMHVFEQCVAEYIDMLWEEGSPKSMAAYVVVATCHTCFPTTDQERFGVVMEIGQDMEPS